MRNASDKRGRENQNVFHVQKRGLFENSAVYEKIWKNIVKPQTTDENTTHAHCILGT
jgi:hypothetical protein